MSEKKPKYNIGDEVWVREYKKVVEYTIQNLDAEEYSLLKSIICREPHMLYEYRNLAKKLLTKEDYCKGYNLPI